jgi:hypothetical protein
MAFSLKNITSMLPGAIEGAKKRDENAAAATNAAVTSALPPSMQQALGAMNSVGQKVSTNPQNIQQALAVAAAAAQAKADQDKLAAVNAPTYQDVSQTYGKAQSDAANKNATEATKGQSYAPITSRFAGAGAYTQANASRTGQVLQNLYSGNAPVNATSGEAKLAAGLAAQGGAAYSQDQEKALKENSQKAYEATNPEAVAKKLLGNLNTIPQGVDLNYQAQSVIAPDVYAAERMDRQARVNENLRTGQTDALAAENELSNRNQAYKDGIKSYITDASKAAFDAAKGTLSADKIAAEGTVNAAKAEVAKAGTDAATISTANQIEKSLGKQLTASGGTVSPEYLMQLRNEAAAEIRKINSELESQVAKKKVKVKNGIYYGTSSIAPADVAKLNKKAQQAKDLQRMASGSREYSGYIDTTTSAQNTAQSELDKIASQYRRFG